MPKFIAHLSGHSNTAGDLFALEILGPQQDLVTAYVSPEYEHTYLARELAGELGCDHEGDELLIELRQRHPATLSVHTFNPIPVEVRYADPRRGAEYIHLGLEDLSTFFDLYRRVPQDPDDPEQECLLLEPTDKFRDWCHILPDD